MAGVSSSELVSADFKKKMKSGIKDLTDTKIKIPDKSNNISTDAGTKQIINTSNTGTNNTKVIEKQTIVQQVSSPAVSNPDKGASMNNFSSRTQDVVASELIGGS